MAGQTGRSLRLSAQGIQKADIALKKFAGKRDLAANLEMSPTTVTNFFAGRPVQPRKFHAICKKLKLDWQEVTDLPKTVESGSIEKNQDNGSDIDELVQEVRSRCCEKIQHLYSKIRLLNRQQIDVDKLYVDVYVLEKLTSESYAKIPDLLKDSNYRDNFDRLGLGQRGERSPGFEIAAHHPRLMILGQPGSGKTTFLRHLAVACCKGEFLADYIPILIELRGINASEFNLFNSIHQEFDLVDEEQTKQILKQGKAVILLDGLDEVPSQSRRDVQDHIYEFSQQQKYYKNRFILTCRTQTTKYISDKFDCVEVAEFTPKQVDEFAKNWFKSFAETPEQGADLTEKFLNKLRLPENQPTTDLAVTPILLSLTCLVFTDLKDLPAKRSDLYEQGINLLLQDWDEKRGVRRTVGSERYRNLSVAEKKKLLSYLAVRKFEQEQFLLFEQSEIQSYIAKYLSISTEESQEVLEAIEAQHGLLIKRAQGIWSFSHLTFQEYFAAKWFCDSSDWDSLIKHITHSHWREVLLLTTGMCEDVNRFLKLMKQQVDALVAGDEHFQKYLKWVNQKSRSLENLRKQAAVRAFYLSRSLNLSFEHRLSCSLDPSFEQYLSDPLSLFSDYCLYRSLHHSYSPDLEQCLYSSGADGPSFMAVSRYLDFELFLGELLKQSVNLEPKLKEALLKLKNQLPAQRERANYKQWWQDNSQAWIGELRDVMINHCDIGHDWLFTEKQKQLLEQYYDANILLVDCLNSGCAVSDEVRKEIEETLLLPIAEIEKRQQWIL
ncbi:MULTISPECIES: NACHT domain-containing protein [unclassified Coleofasciculus]|uniref:NACHT domain-containing protein n=1 Tax=unclassified Coleofasciculus TaxID=2692782 RepID=UPI00188107EB|nr:MULTISPECIES: NACHT domain-containing NTPase [unclassified Coleofasciculus]MBE9130064.1 NACHT domain-containing NTPase [Coleofasciculus sp. LEGE 07081]MBE9152316.1 NACHT domain-containing NTPase [Coleofasciculus sp. LEGE 07092]